MPYQKLFSERWGKKNEGISLVNLNKIFINYNINIIINYNINIIKIYKGNSFIFFTSPYWKQFLIGNRYLNSWFNLK